MRKDLCQQRVLVALVALAAVASVGVPPAAAQPEAAPRALAAVHPGGVDFLPQVAYSKAVLTVSGNGNDYRYELRRGDRLSLGVFDPEGQLLADGAYTWELRLVPTEAEAARLRAAAAENGEAAGAWRAESGTFTIAGGAIADPDLAEAEPARVGAPGLAAALPAELAASAPAQREAAVDSDAAVGLRRGVEARSAAASAVAPSPSAGAPSAAPGLVDSDATTLALGAPAEALDRPQTAAPPTRAVPLRTVSEDGAHGRPRPGDDQ